MAESRKTVCLFPLSWLLLHGQMEPTEEKLGDMPLKMFS